MGCLETARYLGCRGGQRQTQSSKQGPDRKARQREGDYDDGAQRQRTQTDYNEHVKAFTKGGGFNRSNYQERVSLTLLKRVTSRNAPGEDQGRLVSPQTASLVPAVRAVSKRTVVNQEGRLPRP